MARAEEAQTRRRRAAKSRIPVFKSVEEEAAFWDTHSLAAFEDELEEVTDVKFIPGGPTKAVTLRLDLATLAGHCPRTRRTCVGLARLWISERVRDEKRKGSFSRTLDSLNLPGPPR
jgi:hypothetical protein